MCVCEGHMCVLVCVGVCELLWFYICLCVSVCGCVFVCLSVCEWEV